MSDFDRNPFADPEISNPFQDPSVTQIRQAAPPGLEEYNPFTDGKPAPPGMAPRTAAPTINTQPAIMKPTEEPPAYSQPQEQSGAAAELLRRQEELERKAAELDRREREMQSLSASGGRKNNWPPLPEKFPVGPCFYHDITVDIPVEFQKTFILGRCLLTWWAAWPGSVWMRHVEWTLACPSSGSCSSHLVHSSDSSFRFFAFFFVYICQFGIYVMQCIGIAGWGASGWISALTGLNRSIPVGIIMILIAALFTFLAAMSLIMFKKVHAMYRTTDASFEKAQQEFATGVMANKTVQTAAATAASRAAQGGFKEQI
ncbi:hypothetical protein FQN60_008110 [Etheostoma spectabile]|uniref:Secretory carrier-associated membrane protein n=1 Tax=Etheostoma spectabile TaxID=54343 RepID=A0A5J5CVK6_9PERO|nr:hypothetical protein FQN60_008110 [Etheostoma spectabile]